MAKVTNRLTEKKEKELSNSEQILLNVGLKYVNNKYTIVYNIYNPSVNNTLNTSGLIAVHYGVTYNQVVNIFASWCEYYDVSKYYSLNILPKIKQLTYNN